jgi:PAS domain-containing protein
LQPPLGRHIRGNPVNELMLGVSHGGEFSMSAPPDLHPPYRVESGGRALAIEELPMQRAVRGEKVIGQIVDAVRADGRTIRLYSNAAPLFDEHGRPRGAVGAFLDITELARAQQALQKANEELEQRVAERTAEVLAKSQFLEAFFQHSLDSLVFLDPQFNFIRVNEAYAKACHRDASEFPGHNHFDLSPHAERTRRSLKTLCAPECRSRPMPNLSCFRITRNGA